MGIDYILIEHPVMMDRFVVAQVVKMTASFVTVHYYSPRDGWRLDETHRRSIKHITGTLPRDCDPAKISSQLEKDRLEMEQTIKYARLVYDKAVKQHIV